MVSVFDQLDWTLDTNSSELLQLVSTQVDEQEQIRQKVRQQLAKDYPAESLGWLPTVTWSAPTLVPLSSFDLRGIQDWPTWDDKSKIKTFTEKIESGWHKPIVAVKTPGARFLRPIDGHTRLSVYWKLRRPVLAWVGKTHAQTGPWDEFHSQQLGLTPQQKEAGFANIVTQLLEFDNDFVPGGPAVRHVRSARGVYFFHEPIGTPITEAQYQALLAARRSARSAHPPGHPDRVSAERDVRQARKQLRGPSADSDTSVSDSDPVAQEVAETQQSAQQVLASVQTEASVTGGASTSKAATSTAASHSDLLAARREAQAAYPAGHPERVAAERAVRQSRSAAKSALQSPVKLGPRQKLEQETANARTKLENAHAEIARMLEHPPAFDSLTPKQQNAVTQLAKGVTSSSIAHMDWMVQHSHAFTKAEMDKLRGEINDLRKAEKELSEKQESGKLNKGLLMHLALLAIGIFFDMFLKMMQFPLPDLAMSAIALMPEAAKEFLDRWIKLG